MKKILLSLLLILASTTTFAQLQVFNNGYATIGTTTQINESEITVGENFVYNYPSGYNFTLHSRASSGSYCIAVKGTTFAPTGATTIGVQGIANGGQSGYIYGVLGGINNYDKNGAGILGTLTQHTGISVPGRYAGYFYGPVKATGDVTAPSFITLSDVRLKENITTLRETGQSALYNILDMNVIKYNYIDNPQGENNDSALVENTKKETHYGLSAQELQKIYPDLVKEGQDGYLGVKYMELVPILIRSIQELKQELDEIRGEKDAKITRSVSDNDKEKAFASSSENILYQNSPNPFKEQTLIRFHLANDVQDASICFFDMNGRLLKKIPVSSEMESVSIGSYELGEGMFLYSLIVNGQEIDTKRMIVSK